MLLHPTTTAAATAVHHQHLRRGSFSPSVPILHSSASGFSRSTLLKPLKVHNSSAIIACSSISKVHNYGTVDYENRPKPNWYNIYKSISMIRDPHKGGAAAVLNDYENEGKTISKLELFRVVKKLRQFRRHNLALEVYEWMNDRAERFEITTSDTAIQLDLIAKVHGILNAEEYFLTLPDSLKDKRIYGSLLNAYVHAMMKERAESLFGEIKDRGYANNALACNVMMTLYMKLKDYDKLESIVSEMMEKNIPLDVFSYNIWLSSRGYQGSKETMENAFEQMKADTKVNPNWTTFCIMASMYIKMGDLEKTEDCLKKIECRITGRDREPFHHLISLYVSLGKKEEVHRIWNVYKSTFPYIPNMGYHTIISSLVRLDDIEGAEKIFDEWLSVKSSYDPRLANLLLGWYMRKGLSEKAKSLFAQMVRDGGKPNSMTWEVLAEAHIKERNMSEALACLKNSVSAEGSRTWRPRPATISYLLNVCEQENDLKSKEKVMEILKQAGCLDHEDYMRYITIPNSMNTKDTFHDNDDDGSAEELLLAELQGRL